MECETVQKMAKETMNYIRKTICAGMKLTEVRELCEQKLRELGADSFWYWDVGAFVFAGEETVISVSGRDYQTSDRMIGNTDIITIDLSPQAKGVWGDYARTIVLENGCVVDEIGNICNEQWQEGLMMEERLHEEMRRFVSSQTTFEELYEQMNRFIMENGYKNLDFVGNLGHSIEKRKQDRLYIEKGNSARLSSVSFFTFEPHIGKEGSRYGFKREDIYYIEDGRAKVL